MKVEDAFRESVPVLINVYFVNAWHGQNMRDTHPLKSSIPDFCLRKSPFSYHYRTRNVHVRPLRA